MELSGLEDVHLELIYLAVNKLITDKTQNILWLPLVGTLVLTIYWLWYQFFPQIPGIYSGLFKWYEILHYLAAEELAFC